MRTNSVKVLDYQFSWIFWSIASLIVGIALLLLIFANLSTWPTTPEDISYSSKIETVRNIGVISFLLLGSSLTSLVVYCGFRFGFIARVLKDEQEMRHKFVFQATVDKRLALLAKELRQALEQEAQVRYEISKELNPEEGLLGKGKAVQVIGQEAKKNFWDLHNLAARLGYKVKESYKYYLKDDGPEGKPSEEKKAPVGQSFHTATG